MTQKKMNVKDATEFIEYVKEAIMNVADEMGIIIAENCVDINLSAVLIHSDEFDIGGNYGSVELRVYWEEEIE